MKKLLFISIITFACFCCNSKDDKKEVNQKDSEIAKKVEQLISEMTLDEKIAEMTQDAPANDRLGIPFMKYGEALHGLWLVLDYYGNTTVYPQAVACASTWEPELIKKMASQTALEARALGVTHCYSPNLDVYAGDARYGRVEESYGEDPYLVSRMGVAFIQGLQGTGDEQFDENHVIATAKHFVGYPENRRGINGGFSDMSERRLREVYLPSFEAAVKEAQVGSVMPGHQDYNGIPCHMNTWLLKDILRDELGFDGFIVSDNNDVGRIETMHFISETRTKAAILGLKAGVDMDLVIGKNVELATYHANVLKDTVMQDPSLMPYIDKATSRILTAKYKLGLFDTEQKEIDEETVNAGREEHREFALEIAEKSTIMLKNDNNLLPIDLSKIKSLAVIGPNAHEKRPKKGTYKLLGGYSGLPPYYVSILDGLKNKVGDKVKINYAKGCDINSFSKEGFSEAVSAAKKSDAVVLVVGSSHKTCGEGGDRSDLDLYGVQNELVEAIHKTGKPVIVVLVNGRPLSINYIAENIPSVLETWYGGMRAGDAVANVIFGDVNPGGKLTMSFPRSVGQVPVTYLERPDFIGSGKGKYRFSDKSPLFPFGYGLSYTTFKISGPKLKNTSIDINGTTTVSVDVTNTGEREGDEVVQLYVRDDFASVGRYLKMLKGFKRITLKPGETKTVSFDLGFEELNVLNQEMKKVVEPGTFTISVGNSSLEKDLQKVTLEVR
ncbi:beta-xylosidase [Seonamhaeicola maritimus]|uniref:Glycosyl hydrolase n=1 Tax=Seonamhaeicola maritimus TaxID=2591822 RepID=A0A5C7GMH8_9FLAO|nr:beta-xylosidase [Seonamhaeicola maritimus]TXG39532.1 glycosyl hydrolase [Seonamhaeicola maritimus]